MSSQHITRREVHYSGQVQGVGFRYTTTRIAVGLNVTGTVENLPDGRVRLVVEGRADELELLLREIDSQLGGYIAQVESNQTAATAEFSDFRVKA